MIDWWDVNGMMQWRNDGVKEGVVVGWRLKAAAGDVGNNRV